MTGASLETCTMVLEKSRGKMEIIICTHDETPVAKSESCIGMRTLFESCFIYKSYEDKPAVEGSLED